MICAAVALLVNASADLTKYAGFEDAKKDQNIVKIAGTLRKDKEMNYDPEKNPNLFSFYLKDVNGVTEKVNLHVTCNAYGIIKILYKLLYYSLYR